MKKPPKTFDIHIAYVACIVPQLAKRQSLNVRFLDENPPTLVSNFARSLSARFMTSLIASGSSQLGILFERSEFQIDTSPRVPVRRVHVSNNLGFSVWYYVPHAYVPGISSLSAGYQDTYMYLRMCQGGVRIMCHICT